jgi:hypothetical protein
MKTLGVFLATFALALAVLFAAVGQLGKIDRQTLVAVLVAAGVAGSVAALRARGRER